MREGTFEAARPYLLWMLETWVERYGLVATAPLGTDNEDPEWRIIPHKPSEATWCVFGTHRGAVAGTEILEVRERWRREENKGLYGSENETCDLHAMSLKSAGTHDLFEWGQTLEHLMDPWLGLAVIATHLRPGGWHVTSAPAHNIPHGEPYHFFQFTPAGLALLCSGAGMSVVEIGYYGNAQFNRVAHLMSFHPGHVPGNQLTDRFWPGGTAEGLAPGKVPMDLKGTAQVVVLSRKRRRGSRSGAGAPTPADLPSHRPPILRASEVKSLWETHVRGRFGWRPSAVAADTLQTNLSALPSCGALGVGEFVALGGLMEGLAKAPPPAGGVWRAALAEQQEGCLGAAARAAVGGGGGGEVAPQWLPLPPPALLVEGGGVQHASGSSLIIMAGVLEYVEDPIAYVCAAVKALRPQGLVWLSARVVAPKDPYSGGRIMLRSITPTALVVTLRRCGAEVVDAGHWGTRDALAQWVERDNVSLSFVLGGAFPQAEWVYAIQGWAMGRKVAE